MPHSPSTSAPRTVVVIDDSDVARRRVTAALEQGGYRVLDAASGELGLKLLLTSSPDALVTDYELPGINGMAVIHRVRSHPALSSLPCILLTGADAAPPETRGLEGGADAYIRKGGSFDVIVARLGALLRGAPRTTVRAAPDEPRGARRVVVLCPKPFTDDIEQVLEGLRHQGLEIVESLDGDPSRSGEAGEIECVLIDESRARPATIQKLKESPLLEHVPILVLARGDDPRAAVEVLQAGADDWVVMASGLDAVAGRIRAHLRRKHAEAQQGRLREEALRRELADAEARAQRELADTRAELLAELGHKNQELEEANTHLARTLREVKVRDDQFRAVARCVPGVVYLLKHDAARTPIFLSVAVESLTGLRAVDFLEGRARWTEIMHPEDRDRVHARVDSAIAQRMPFETTYRIQHTGGDWRWVEERGRAIFDEDEVRCVGGAMFDVTERLKAEEELERFRTRQRTPGSGTQRT